MFKKLMSLFSSKKEQKKSIGFNTEEPKEDDKFYKFNYVHETFSIWCASTSKGGEVEGHEVRFDEGARTKEIFARRAEIQGWRCIEGDWHCPACVNTKNDK